MSKIHLSVKTKSLQILTQSPRLFNPSHSNRFPGYIYFISREIDLGVKRFLVTGFSSGVKEKPVFYFLACR